MTEHAAAQGRLEGTPASPGIIIGKAHLVGKSRVKILYQYLVDEQQLNREVERFQEALRTEEDKLLTVKSQLPNRVKEHTFILDSHLMILKDSMLVDATIKRIMDEKINAEWALKESLDEIRDVFEQIDDEYIRSRITDVENVIDRILRSLSGKTGQDLIEIEERMIIVAHDLSPVDTAELNISKIMGFITDIGGRTSHTAIMAQALEIPAVVGLESATELVQDGDLLIVDGNTGEVVINPDDSAIIFFQEKQLQREKYKSAIASVSHLPAETLDGHKVAVRANIEFQEELEAAKSYGAEGIGLYRTEFLYMRSKRFPSEEELFENYRDVAETINPAPVTIRTLDLGGDKLISEPHVAKEVNPALGLRAIRLSLKEPKVFRTQLRAILRASAYGRVQIMFPMISGLEEVLEAKEILSNVKDGLDNQGVDYDHDIKTGIIIEIPSAVAVADILAHHVDFFSMGTNDLIQYALAVDRINEHVAYMYQPLHPAILKMIQQVVIAGKQAGIPVAVCGEMAGDPLCVSMLLGMGIGELSMTTRAIPVIKKLIRSISLKEAHEDFHNMAGLSTAREMRAYILDRMKKLLPELDEKGYLNT